MDKRLKIFQIIVIILFGLLLFKAGHLQLVRGDYYTELSEGNRISIRPINAPRGKVYVNSGENDSEYETLVSNKLSYNLYILPNEIPAELTVDDLLEKVAELIDLEVVQINEDNIENLDYQEDNLDIDEIKEKVDSNQKEYDLLKDNYESNRESNKYRSLPVLLKKNISSENMLIIEENKKDLPGILVKESTIRKYLYDDIAAHVLEGVERKYTGDEDNYLKGDDGLEQIEVNNLGEEIRTLGIKPPVSGDNLVLNLNLELQKITEKLMHEEFEKLRNKAEENDISKPTGMGVIVMDPKTGAIKTMSSIPGYDLNMFAKGISSEELNKINNNKLKPLFNRNIMAEVPPGSIFKLVTGAAAIENLNVKADSVFYDRDGTFSRPEWETSFKNWYPAGEGELTFTRAIGRSNNIIFYQLGYKLYQEFKGKKLVEFARKFGLGSKTDIDLPEEKSGLVPDGEWKRNRFGQGWLPGDSINLSIGQGNL
ncbi:MAG: penicillin-binding transpeptidase domain-containing protein, partial [Bacillota bacterium]